MSVLTPVQQSRNATLKVGLLTLISLLILVSAIIWLRGRAMGGGQHFEVLFNDIDGMRAGAPVQYMGVRVGFVDDITPIASKQNNLNAVKINFTISDTDLNVPAGTELSVQQSGLIGEKFLEMTPPTALTYTLASEKPLTGLKAGMPLKVIFADGPFEVGQIKSVYENKDRDIIQPDKPYRYRISYWVTQPGYAHPLSPQIKYVTNPTLSSSYLLIDDSSALTKQRPEEGKIFIVVEPLRLKTFLEKQLLSAEAIQLTNEKINQLLNDDTVKSIQETLKNTQILTAKSTQVLNHADRLFTEATGDLKRFVNSTEKVADSVSSLTNNINQFTASPELKQELTQTVRNIRKTSGTLADLLEDPDLKTILGETKVTSHNAADISTELRKVIVEDKLPEKVSQAVDSLIVTLDNLSLLLNELDKDNQSNGSLKAIIQNTREASQNIRKFSKKINGHFLLFKLLF